MVQISEHLTIIVYLQIQMRWTIGKASLTAASYALTDFY